MTQIVDRLFGLIGNLMGFLLDWPFLLFVLLVWIANRYRDQIGSMLDRRGAVGAGEIANAVRREMEPIAGQVEAMSPEISRLRSDVEQLRSLYSEDRITAALDPVLAKTRALDGMIAGMRADLERLFRRELTDALKAERDEIQKETAALGEALQRQSSLLADAAPRDAFDRLSKTVDGLGGELGSLKEKIEGLTRTVGAVESAAKKAGAELDKRVSGLLEPVNEQVGALRKAVAEVRGLSEAAASREVTQDLQRRLAPLVGELADVKNAMKAFQSDWETATQALEERVTGNLAPVKQELDGLKAALQQLAEKVEAIGQTPASVQQPAAQELVAGDVLIAAAGNPGSAAAAPAKPRPKRQKRVR